MPYVQTYTAPQEQQPTQQPTQTGRFSPIYGVEEKRLRWNVPEERDLSIKISEHKQYGYGDPEELAYKYDSIMKRRYGEKAPVRMMMGPYGGVYSQTPEKVEKLREEPTITELKYSATAEAHLTKLKEQGLISEESYYEGLKKITEAKKTETEKAPEAIRNFEFEFYGKEVPEKRGTPEWKQAKLAWTKSKAEAGFIQRPTGELTENQVSQNLLDLAMGKSDTSKTPEQLYSQYYGEYRDLVIAGMKREEAYSELLKKYGGKSKIKINTSDVSNIGEYINQIKNQTWGRR